MLAERKRGKAVCVLFRLLLLLRLSAPCARINTRTLSVSDYMQSEVCGGFSDICV